jgi:hypothetical protein
MCSGFLGAHGEDTGIWLCEPVWRMPSSEWLGRVEVGQEIVKIELLFLSKDRK